MGIYFGKMSQSQCSEEPIPLTTPVEGFKFHGSFPEDSNNGLVFNDVYIPAEIVTLILSYVEPSEILTASRTCKRWCNIIKSYVLWSMKYNRKYNKRAKRLPWYVYYCLFATNYFDTNLIRNGNGESQFDYWKIVKNYGDEFRIEKTPAGADPLPADVPEFNGQTSCFATSYYECNKLQKISLENCPLIRYILNEHKPHIYVSEWTAGRFDCGCLYTLWCKLYAKANEEVPRNTRWGPHEGSDFRDSEDEEIDLRMRVYRDDDDDSALHIKQVRRITQQWDGKAWEKVEILIQDYPKHVDTIVFQHEGRDTQFWKGHYGSKMAGGVVKILFNTIE